MTESHINPEDLRATFQANYTNYALQVAVQEAEVEALESLPDADAPVQAEIAARKAEVVKLTARRDAFAKRLEE